MMPGNARSRGRVETTAGVLASLLLDPGDCAFVRALLCRGEPARAAWQAWVRGGGDWTDPHQARGRIAKAFAPLLLEAVAREGIAIDRPAMATLRAWRLAERERATRYAAILEEVLATLSAANVVPVIVGGAAFAWTLYDDPSQRHCHDIDLLVGGDRTPDAASRPLLDAGFVRDPRGPHGSKLTLHHASGLPVILRGDALATAPGAPAFSDVPCDSRSATIGGRQASILGHAHALALACLPAFMARHRIEAARGMIDAARLAAVLTDAEWREAAEVAARQRLSLLLLSVLRWLDEASLVRAPGDVVEAVSGAADATVSHDRARVVPTLAGAPRSLGAVLDVRAPWPVRIAVSLDMLVPPAEYVRPANDEDGDVKLGMRYLRRVARWWSRGPASA